MKHWWKNKYEFILIYFLVHDKPKMKKINPNKFLFNFPVLSKPIVKTQNRIKLIYKTSSLYVSYLKWKSVIDIQLHLKLF